MKLFNGVWYPEKKIEILNKTIVEILTLEERSSIEQGYYDNLFGRQQKRSFAINYAWKIGDNSPILRGFEFEGKLYEIDSSRKLIISQKSFGELFYDSDKIEKNDFVFEGSLNEFVSEFIKSGYQLKTKI